MRTDQTDVMPEQEYVFTHDGIGRDEGYMSIPTEWTWTPELVGLPLAVLVMAANIHVEGRPVTAPAIADAMSIDVDEARKVLQQALALEFVEQVGPPNGRVGMLT